MIGKCSPSSRRWRWRRRAATLVEVLAALTLLAVLLTTIVQTRARLTRQAVAADQKLRAAAAADALLAGWWQDVRALPRSGSGAVSGQPDLVWRTQVVRNAAAAALGTEVVRLEIAAAARPAEAAPAVAVEVVLDVEQATSQPAQRVHRH